MKINYSKIPFQKTLKATCKVKGVNDKVRDAKIYRLDDIQNDLNEFIRANDSANWQGNMYLEEMYLIFKNLYHEEYDVFDFYVMENEKKEPICFAMTDKMHKGSDCLEYIEVAPRFSKDNKNNRKMKYVGETMMSFLINVAKKRGLDFRITDIAPRQEAVDFYDKQLGFEVDELESSGFMPKENFDDLILKNQKHTGHKIMFKA